jgi:Protein of unknown function (DUF1631)
MPTTAQLLRFIEDELSRATPMAERVQAGTLQLLRDPRGATPASNERAATFELTEALQRRGTAFRDGFVTALRTRVMAELAASQAHALPDGQGALELMDESRVLVDIEISRAVQLIDTTAEWELRELQTFTSTLGGQAHVSTESNPLRPSVFAAALWDATAALGDSQSLRFAVLRVAAGVLAGLLKTEWAAACSRLEAQGVEPGAYRTVVLKPGAGPARAEIDVTQPGATRSTAGSSNCSRGCSKPSCPMPSCRRPFGP